MCVFFSVEQENSNSEINTINVLFFGKLAKDCAKVFYEGVKYFHIYFSSRFRIIDDAIFIL